MSVSWLVFSGKCKSRLSALARCCFLGRRRWREKYQQLKRRLLELKERLDESQTRVMQLEQEVGQLREHLIELQALAAHSRSVEWPIGDVLPGQQFGVGMVMLCVNLAREIGLRPVGRVLRIFSEWMNVDVRIPRYQTIRGWMQRIGLDRMNNAGKTNGGVWITDHTNQIGKEKVLVVLRVRDSHLPEQGVPLGLEDLEVLTIVPGTDWKREKVGKEYQRLAERYGVPRAIESDGAVELREPVATLENAGKTPLTVRDPKHFLANRFEAILNKNPEYPEFAKQLGWARSALVQTELSHFVPPSAKAKSRFMNLASILNWATVTLWHLDNPDSLSRRGIEPIRMEEKLGWLRAFEGRIKQWQECQEVISLCLTFVNEQGIFAGARKCFENIIAEFAQCPTSRELVSQICEFLSAHENQLEPGERLPMSTEVIESSFARYKHFEKQHSKNGFSTLLLTYPTLLRPTTAQEVRASFARVRNADVQAWIKKNMPSTLASKRQLVYREPSKPCKDNTTKRATPSRAAA